MTKDDGIPVRVVFDNGHITIMMLPGTAGEKYNTLSNAKGQTLFFDKEGFFVTSREEDLPYLGGDSTE
jgi:hypothetical protein